MPFLHSLPPSSLPNFVSPSYTPAWRGRHTPWHIHSGAGVAVAKQITYCALILDGQQALSAGITATQGAIEQPHQGKFHHLHLAYSALLHAHSVADAILAHFFPSLLSNQSSFSHAHMTPRASIWAFTSWCRCHCWYVSNLSCFHCRQPADFQCRLNCNAKRRSTASSRLFFSFYFVAFFIFFTVFAVILNFILLVFLGPFLLWPFRLFFFKNLFPFILLLLLFPFPSVF